MLTVAIDVSTTLPEQRVQQKATAGPATTQHRGAAGSTSGL